MRRGDRAWVQAGIAVFIGVGLALVLGYGGIWPQASPGATNVQLQHTLLVWSGFPAGSAQRPLVLSGSRVLPPAGGFPDKADTTAFYNGAINPPASYPPTPGSADGYGLVPAADAVAVMGSAEATGTRLQITRVKLGMGTFQTDRGPRRLPAWKLWFSGVRNPAIVAAARTFNPPGLLVTATPSIHSSAVSADGRTLIITFGTGTHPCGRFYLNVAESRTAVAIAVLGTRGRAGNCAATRQQATTLTRPLGGRVLVDGLTGDPITVSQPRTQLASEPPMSLQPIRRHHHARTRTVTL